MAPCRRCICFPPGRGAERLECRRDLHGLDVLCEVRHSLIGERLQRVICIVLASSAGVLASNHFVVIDNERWARLPRSLARSAL